MVHVALMTGEDKRKTARKAVDDLGRDLWKLLKSGSYLFVYADISKDCRETLRGMLDIIRLYADVPVVIGDAPERGAMRAFGDAGLDLLPQEFADVHLLDLTKDYVVEHDFAREQGGWLTVRRPKTAVEAPVRLHVGPVADWSLGTWIVPPREMHGVMTWSKVPFLGALEPEERQRFLAELFLTYPSQMSLQDGILPGSVLASLDPVAADTVFATLQGEDPHGIMHLEQIAGRGAFTNEIADTDISPGALQEFMSFS